MKELSTFWAKLTFGATENFSSILSDFCSNCHQNTLKIMRSNGSNNSQIYWIGLISLMHGRQKILTTIKQISRSDVMTSSSSNGKRKRPKTVSVQILTPFFIHYHEMESYLVELVNTYKYNTSKFKSRTHHRHIT